MADIGTTIRILRQTLGIGLGELARSASLSSPYLSLVESGKRNPSLDAIDRIAQALGVPVDVLLLSGSAAGSQLRTDDDMAASLQASIAKLVRAESALRESLKTGGRNDPVGTDACKNRRRNGAKR